MRLVASQNASVKSHKKWSPGISGRLGNDETHACLFFYQQSSFIQKLSTNRICVILLKFISLSPLTTNLAT